MKSRIADVLNDLREATAGADGKVMPIYVDPVGLAEADKTMSSTVRMIEFDGVPLRASLQRCLKQLDLGFRVTEGYVLITSQESLDQSSRTVAEDAFHVVGRCLLAFIAAGIGGLAARFCLRSGAKARG